MSDITFLEEKQIWGDNALEIFKKYGTKCAITDFSILLGGYVSSDDHTSEGTSMSDRTGWYWTRTDDGGNDARVVRKNGSSDYSSVILRVGGCRPALPYSSIKPISSNEVRGSSGVLEVKYGEYPQMIENKLLSNTLEKLYTDNILKKTGKEYTTDSQKYDEYDKSYTSRTFEEYEKSGQRYIRFVGDYNGKGKKLSDGRGIEEGQAYWIKVEPLVWQVDEKADIAVSKKIIFAGVQFKNTRDYKGDFENTNIKQFMEYCFSMDIIQGYINEESKTTSVDGSVMTSRKQNPYNFNFDGVSEEEIIRGAVESNIAVFLHGRSSEGKSARVKQLDKDCEIIYLGTATPESLNGKSVYDASTGEMKDIAPTWFKKISKKCEEEPDKIHIVFFDELTNAMPSIQKYAFNIVLDKEVNGIWKLPKNCRVVAAGNEIEDSLAANQMAEPLFNRFAHVYINTTVESWLKWAVTPDSEYERIDYKEEVKQAKIHPSIYAYIAYKSCMKKSVLRTKYDGIKPNADPRKWEMASKVLYATKNPNMLRGLIGEDLTKDFVNFCKKEVITVEDVINGNYSWKDFEMKLDERFATAVGLSRVEEKDLKVVREFVRKLGAEIQATFDSLWAQGDEKRLEKLAEAEIENNVVRR